MEGLEFKKHIKAADGFQSSVNVCFDFTNEEKIKNFIPTTASLEIIEDLMLSTVDSSADRARILIGAYGKGKSHMILVLLALLTNKDLNLFSTLLPKIKAYSHELYDYVIDYLNSDTKLLPVIIQGSSTSLSQSFLGSLQKALEAEGLEDLMPETYFKAAVERINDWKQNYPETYSKFASYINQPINDFVLRLLEFDVEAYNQFVTLYPSLTAGSEFNPFLGSDVIELYSTMVDKLHNEGYRGVFVVYDEFSKFLEADITKVSSVDIKLLQDFAEKCNRSKDKQMHLLLISHKDISNYIDKLPKQKVDGWKGVSERFKHVEVQNEFSQVYDIIATVIQKDKRYFDAFFKRFSGRFSDIADCFIQTDMFNELEEDGLDTVIYGCYPLHPVSTFILPRLSEKVAQNERTLFSFLSAPHKNTLSAFIEAAEGDFPILTPDYIYDYFEPLLKKESYISDIYKKYILASDILAKLEPGSLGSKIIKTIALIYIIDQFEKLPPTPEVLINTFRESVTNIAKITDVLQELQDKQYVLYLKRSNNYLRLKKSVSVDISTRITNTAEKIKATKQLKDILNDMSFDNYLYPTSYNDDNEIIRYFDFIFISGEEFLAVENWEKKIERTAGDGAIYGIIPKDDEEIAQIREVLLSEHILHERVIFVLPLCSFEVDQIAYEYQAVKQLKEQSLDDISLVEELNIYIEDMEEVLERFISAYLRPEQRQVEFFHKGQKQILYRKAHISKLLSCICNDTFDQAPIINNEVVNKDFLSTAAINSRSKVIDGLLNNQLQPNLGLIGTGQDTSIMRSTLIMTGILKDADSNPQLSIVENEDAKIQNVLDVISEFFKSTSDGKTKSFSNLYSRLTKPEFHIGLKKGVIPIYIAVVLHFYKQHIVIMRNRRELEITSELLNSINENPEEYYVCLEDWNDKKAAYISALEEIFKDEILPPEKEYNTFSYIVRAMQRWFVRLPSYAKEIRQIYLGGGEYKRIEREKLRFIVSLKAPELNAREYLFDTIFSIFGHKTVMPIVSDNIRAVKLLLDGAKESLIQGLILDVRLLFHKGQVERASLSSVIKDWYDDLKDTTKNHLFSSGEERILELMRTINNDDGLFIERLAKALTGLRIDDWYDESIAKFNAKLKEFKDTVEAQDKSYSEPALGKKSNIYRLTFVDEEGNEHTKTFAKTEYSGTSILLVNEIAAIIDEYGEALSEGEKRQVLIDIIEKIS